jgi:putative addiction module component (TIGR02574 family)
MTVSLKALGLEHLSVEDRLALDESIWESIAADPDAVSLTQAQFAELDRRLAEDDVSPDSAIAWSEVKAAALARFGE